MHRVHSEFPAWLVFKMRIGRGKVLLKQMIYTNDNSLLIEGYFMDSERVLLPFTTLLNSVWRCPLPNNLIGKEATLIAYLANLLVHIYSSLDYLVLSAWLVGKHKFSDRRQSKSKHKNARRFQLRSFASFEPLRRNYNGSLPLVYRKHAAHRL